MAVSLRSWLPSASDVNLHLQLLFRTFALVWSAARRWHAVWLGLLVVQGVLPVASVYLTRALVDGIVESIPSGASWESARPALVLVTLMVAVLVLTELLKGALEWVAIAQAELVQDHISGLIHQKTSTVDLSFFDSPEFYDRLHRVRTDSASRSLALLENTGGLLQNGITLFAMAGVLLPYGFWIPAVLFVGTLPALLVLLRYNSQYHAWWDRTTADRRWTQYYDLLLTHLAAAAELRLFGLGPFFQSAYQALRERLRGERIELSRSQAWSRLLAGAAALVAMGVTMGWMIWQALQGFATLGDLALFQQAFSRGQSLMRTLLENVGRIYSNSLFVRDLFEFLALAPGIREPARVLPAPRQLTRGIRFRNVSFGYAGSPRPALRNLNISIAGGQVAAVVGPNGAGKSTLLKLLCRFYDPDAGQIEFDGLDIRRLSLVELRRTISVLFQLPVQYFATAGENISFGDHTGMHTAADIERAAQAAGADEMIARLPHGYDTLLGRHFGNGVELSAGEWQRLALARACLRQSPIIVLDEPTSFMDSWAEADWLDRFDALARGRTAVLITHRFTTAMRAHTIFVMDGGEVVEHGSHDELVARGGLYARSWNRQTRSTVPLPA
jgi:ATP-binding cassette subfamily B protein